MCDKDRKKLLDGWAHVSKCEKKIFFSSNHHGFSLQCEFIKLT